MHMNLRTFGLAAVSAVVTAGLVVATVSAQAAPDQQTGSTVKPTQTAPPKPAETPKPSVAGTRATFLAPPPPDYIIGPDDVLTISFWRDPTMSGDFVVRPDGKISMPLINDIQAAGLTPEALGASVTEAAKEFIETPTVSVVVKQIKSRKVYIVGMVAKPGPYEMTGPMTLVQLIAVAGGLQEFSDKKHVLVMRTENGKNLSYTVNYDDLTKGKNLGQNILLRPGDTVVVR